MYRRAAPCDAHTLLAFGDLQLGDPRLLHEVDELLKLAQIHKGFLPRRAARRHEPPGRAGR